MTQPQPCCRYVELNPVRARMVESPETYKWSSYRRHVRMENEFGWLDVDPYDLGLGNSASERAARYRDFVQSVIPDGEWELILQALQRGRDRE